MFYSPVNWDQYGSKKTSKNGKKIPYSAFFKEGFPSMVSLEEHPSWDRMILTLKHEPVEIVTFFWWQWQLKSKIGKDGSRDGLQASLKKQKPKDPDNLAAVNSPSILIGNTLNFNPLAGSRTYKLPIGEPLFIGIRYNILDTTDSNYV